MLDYKILYHGGNMMYGQINFKGYTREAAKKSVGKGWATLIDNVFDALESVEGTVKIIQVKEKWGGLRIYTDVRNSKLDPVVSHSERESFHICEDCGNPGVLRDGGWFMTKCDEHSEGHPPIPDEEYEY